MSVATMAMVVAALGLAHRRVVLLADLQLRRFRDELDFLLAGDRVDAATGKRQPECSHLIVTGIETSIVAGG